MQTRTVTCIAFFDSTATEVAHSACAASAEPTMEQPCNTLACLTLEVWIGDWGECSTPCGSGVQDRKLECLEGSNVGTPNKVEVQDCVEEGLVAAETLVVNSGTLAFEEQACNTDVCEAFFWQPESQWGRCNVTCGGGVQGRSVVCVSSTDGSVSDPIGCNAAEEPETQRACNTAPCVAYAWNPGDWSECSVDCGGGTMSRSVSCVGSDGSEDVSGELCLAVSEQPSTTTSCNNNACDFCDGQDCSGHGLCTDGVCACEDGHTGVTCSLPPGCDGTMDAAGGCCSSGVVDNAGVCCEAAPGSTLAPVLDAEGQCCGLGVTDICGVCNGTAIVVDSLGTCCSGILDPGNVCCESSYLDECGLCDGDDSSCATEAAMDVPVDGEVPTDPDSAEYQELQAAVSQDVGDSLGVDPERIIITDISDGVRRRQLLQSASAGVAFVVMPPTSEEEPVVSVLDLVRGLADSNMGTVTYSGRSSECGNGQCESGETCQAGREDDSQCCLEDCPFVLKTCPAPTSLGESSLPCGGNGKCLVLSGSCECFTGYAGTDCGSCAGAQYDEAGTKLLGSYLEVNTMCKLVMQMTSPPPPPPPLVSTVTKNSTDTGSGMTGGTSASSSSINLAIVVIIPIVFVVLCVAVYGGYKWWKQRRKRTPPDMLDSSAMWTSNMAAYMGDSVEEDFTFDRYFSNAAASPDHLDQLEENPRSWSGGPSAAELHSGSRTEISAPGQQSTRLQGLLNVNDERLGNIVSGRSEFQEPPEDV